MVNPEDIAERFGSLAPKPSEEVLRVRFSALGLRAGQGQPRRLGTRGEQAPMTAEIYWCRASNSANSPMNGAAISALTLQSRRMGPSGLLKIGPRARSSSSVRIVYA